MESNAAAIYALIHAFLKQKQLDKVAETLRKAVKDVVVLKGIVDTDEPPLDEIVSEWKMLRLLRKSSSSDSDSDSSSDDSSSDSDSDSGSKSDDDSNNDSDSSSSNSSDSSSSSSSSSSEVSAESTTKHADTKKIQVEESDTSVTLSSQALETKGSAVNNSDDDSKDSDDDSEDSDNDDESSEDDAAKNAKDSSDSERTSSSTRARKQKSIPKVLQRAQSSSNSSESDLSDTTQKTKAKKVVSEKQQSVGSKKGKANAKTPSSSHDPSSSSDPKAGKSVAVPVQIGDKGKVVKRRRLDEAGADLATAISSTAREDETEKPVSSQPRQNNGKQSRKQNERFSRIPRDVVAGFNNGYEAKGGTTDDYGARAHQDLIVTRGSGFRKEKNKKKRGSYRGGEITMESHSFKYAD